MEIREVSAKTVEEAREIALKELGVGPGEAEVEVLSRGKPGRFLGIGGEPARVRVRRVGADAGQASLAVETVSRVLQAAGTATTVNLRSAHDAQTGGPIIDIMGDDSGLLIGRKGETLRALQFVVNLMVRQRVGETSTRVILDIERYRERRHSSLRSMALRVADKVAASGRAITLEPMSAAERRVVHLALADHPRVISQSAGIGEDRRVTVAPRQPFGRGTAPQTPTLPTEPTQAPVTAVDEADGAVL